MVTRVNFVKNSLKWLILFLVLVLAPLFLAAVGHSGENRGFLIEFGVAIGFIGLAMMGLQFVLTARYSKIGAPFGLDELLQFHGQMGYIAWGFIIGHFIILFVADLEYLKFLDPTVNLPRAVALIGVIIAITALVATTCWREKMGIIYEWWRASHGVLALFVVFVGTVHILQVGYYISELWQQITWAGLSLAAMGMLIHNRVWRPMQMRKKPWRVSNVMQEVDGIWSIEFEPDGHPGLDFTAGQFVWVTFGNSPFSLQQHPFTISSSPEKKSIRLTIKELGDFTSEIGNVELGSKAFIEGPYGSFTLSESRSIHSVFIVGGIGITPVVSVLDAMRNRQDQREFTVIYGTPSKELTPFYEELKVYSAELNVDIVHVLENPPEDWQGETGLIDNDVMKRHVPTDFSNCEFFVCGPPPMMDAVETTLNSWGVPVYRVNSERFNIA